MADTSMDGLTMADETVSDPLSGTTPESEETGDSITIENYSAKLPPINHSDTTRQLYGVVDMGSNGIRFSITDLSPPNGRLLRCIYRERAAISLYDALHECSATWSEPLHFSPEIIVDVAEALGRFKRTCDFYGVPEQNILVFATEAMRTARNRDDMLNIIREESGLKVNLLSPAMESMFGAVGARSGFQKVEGLFMDLGGGSVQMTYMNSAAPEYYTLAAQAARSMPFGAAKLTEQLMQTNTAMMAKRDLKQNMQDAFDKLKARFPNLREQAEGKDGRVNIYLCGGGFRGYGSMLMHTDPIQPYPIPVIGGYAVTGHRFSQWTQLVEANEEKGKIFGLSKRRRKQFPAIVTVVQAILATVPNIGQVIFCNGGNREGVLYMRLPPEIREGNIMTLLPADCNTPPASVLKSILQTLVSALPTIVPTKVTGIPTSLFAYLAKTMYMHSGLDDSINSAKFLHRPLSGALSTFPLSHTERAIFALTMCTRWGTDIAPVDRVLYNGLRKCIGPHLSFMCDYIGTVARALAAVVPITVTDWQLAGNEFERQFQVVSTRWSSGMGKKGNKEGIYLHLTINPTARKGIDIEALKDLFKKVGKGIDEIDWSLEISIDEGVSIA